MLVKNWMSKNVVAIDADDSVREAEGLLVYHEVRMIPVMEGGMLIGVISDRDIKKASVPESVPSDLATVTLSAVKVKTAMTKGAITVTPDHTVEEAAELLIVNKISGVPVVSPENKVIGVITQSDLFRAMISLTGTGKHGVQFAFYVKDEPGCIRKITDTIRDYGGRIASILATHERCAKGYRRIYVRVYNIDQPSLERLKEVLKEKSTIIYIVDHSKKTREIFEEPLS